MLGHMWDVGPGMGWWMVWAGLWNLLFWGAVIGLVVWAVQKFAARGGPDEASPLNVAKARYARGEISREQYEEIANTLSPA